MDLAAPESFGSGLSAAVETGAKYKWACGHRPATESTVVKMQVQWTCCTWDIVGLLLLRGATKCLLDRFFVYKWSDSVPEINFHWIKGGKTLFNWTQHLLELLWFQIELTIISAGCKQRSNFYGIVNGPSITGAAEQTVDISRETEQ